MVLLTIYGDVCYHFNYTYENNVFAALNKKKKISSLHLQWPKVNQK